jgi:diguanylate cyclase (GGDEF)-like protein
MPWRNMLPRSRWLPRAALMHPQRVVVVGFSAVMLLLIVVGLRDLYTLRERVVATRQHELTLRAMGLEALFAAERFKLSFVRDYAQQLITIYQNGEAGAADAAIEQAFGARNEAEWQMAVPLGDSPVIGVSAEALRGLDGFARRDEDLRADLYAARQLSHVLGLSRELRSDNARDAEGAVVFVSSNGLYVTYPAFPVDRARALIRRFSGIAYYREVLPGQDAGREIRLSPAYAPFESTGLSTALSIPIYVHDRFRGVVSVDVDLQRIGALIGTPEQGASQRFLMDREGDIVASSNPHRGVNMRWPDNVGEAWRKVRPPDLFEARAGMRHADGQYLFFESVGQRGNWLLLETLSDVDLYRAVFRRISLPLLAIWLALPLLMFVSLRVVTQLFDHYVAAGEKLRQMAETDPLTQLANRRHFSEQFRKESARRMRDRKPLAMLMLDIDFFKRVNDRWGHASGDLVLRALADALRDNLRAVDLPARLGGEEFAVLLPGATLPEVAATAERLRAAVQLLSVEPAPDALPSGADGERIHFTVSIGVAEAGIDGCQSFDAMLATADRRLYAAKAAGRNQVRATDARADSATDAQIQQ